MLCFCLLNSSAKLNLRDKNEKEDIYELPQLPQRDSSDRSVLISSLLFLNLC